MSDIRYYSAEFRNNFMQLPTHLHLSSYFFFLLQSMNHYLDKDQSDAIKTLE